MDSQAKVRSMRPTGAPATLILTRGDIASFMTVDVYLESAREAFLALGNGRAQSPMPLYLPADGGGIHAKDGIEVPSGAKIVEVDPRGDRDGVKGLGERPKRIADGVRRAIEERLPQLDGDRTAG